ncbi:hypothetical protein HK405_000186, partial [Cladochytrium tenue]
MASSSSTYDLASILVPGNCYSSPYAIGLPIVDYGYSCTQGFLCPNSSATVLASLPQICPPTVSCQLQRLASKLCSGFYCPTSNSILICPVGSTSPRPCPALSSCPQGSVTATYYGGIVACAIIDVALAAAVLTAWFLRRRRARLRQEHGDGERQRRARVASVAPEPRQLEPPPAALRKSARELGAFVEWFRRAAGSAEDDDENEGGMEFRFEGLGLRLRNGQSVLRGVTGRIHARRVT